MPDPLQRFARGETAKAVRSVCCALATPLKRGVNETDIMQERQRGSQSKPSQTGDTPSAEFRKQLHELADWIADFREHIEGLRVAPNDKPGAIRGQLPKRAPDEGEPFEKILAD